MLDSFRKLERSWTTYIMFFIICAMFVVGYMPCLGQNVESGATGAAVAHVDGHVIGHNLVNIGQGALSLDRTQDAQFFGKSRSMFFQLGNGGNRIAFDDFANASFNQSSQDASPIPVEKVVNDLVEVYLVSDLALSLGLDVSDDELSQRIRTARAFQSPEGAFSGSTAYERFLSRYGLSPQDFEVFFKRYILRERVIDLYKGMYASNDAEVQFYLQAMSNKIDIEFLRLNPRPLAGQIAPLLTEVEVAEYAKTHEKEIAAAYAKPVNQMRYVTPEKVQMHGVWINPNISTDRDMDKAKEKANQVRAEIDAAVQKNGGTPEALLAAFESAANDHSDHVDSKKNGGAFTAPLSKADLARYPFVDQDGAELIFSAKPGTLVGPVSSRYGVWLILAGDHTPKVIVPVETATPAIARELLAEEKAKAEFDDIVKELVKKCAADGAEGLDAVTLAWSTARGYEGNAFPSRKTGLFGRIAAGGIPPRIDQLGYIPFIGVSSEMMDQAFALTPESRVAPTAFSVDGEDGHFIIRLVETKTDDEETMKTMRTALAEQLQIYNASTAYRGMVVELFQKTQKSKTIYTNIFHQMRQAQLKSLEENLANGGQ